MNIVNDLTMLIKKLNFNKKTLIFLIVGFLMIVILFLSELDFNEEKEDVTNEISDEEYCDFLENKVENFIERIDGAGETEVIITLAETTEYIYATDDRDIRKNNTNSDDSTIEKDYVIIENENNDVGLLIKTVLFLLHICQ